MASAAPVQSNSLTINETQVTIDESDQINSGIYGDRIVWVDWRNVTWEIYMYDFLTSRETQITPNSSNSQNPACPAIYGNRIGWEDGRVSAMETRISNGNKDIYMYTVSEVDTGSGMNSNLKQE
jgi:beta propeller repeat protein